MQSLVGGLVGSLVRSLVGGSLVCRTITILICFRQYAQLGGRSLGAFSVLSGHSVAFLDGLKAVSGLSCGYLGGCWCLFVCSTCFSKIIHRSLRSLSSP